MVQEILSRLNIYSYIGKIITLKHKGRDQYLGLCPFHNEKTPSFSVSAEKGLFHCFGCKASGDIVKFVMLYNNIDYDQAIEKLATETGIKYSIKTKSFDIHNISLDINNKFAVICNEMLKDKSTYYGLDYLHKRGLKDNMIDRYNLGYLPNNRSIAVLKKLMSEFSKEEIFKSGLFKENINGKPYCQFNNRIIFPIIDNNNKVAGFGSRVIIEGAKPKYLNSSDSDFFHKSELLYGLNKIYGDKQLKESKTVFVVEGYMDVISLANHGITNCVGVLGTHFTINQLKKLWTITDRPTICFDNDLAGHAAMEKVARLAIKVIEPCKSISFLPLHNCKDPDEFIVKYGREQLINYAKDNKLSLADFIYRIESSELSLTNPDEIVVLRQRIEKILNEITNDLLRNEYKRHFNKVFYNKQIFKKNYKKHDIKDLKFIPQYINSIEEQICQIISQNLFLLMDQEILDDFMTCKFNSDVAEKMRMQLTKNIDYKSIVNSDINIKKNLQSLILSLKIRNIKNEIANFSSTEMNEQIESRLLDLKKYEIELKNKLSSTLI